MPEPDGRRLIPRTDDVLAQPLLAEPLRRLGPALVKKTVQSVLASTRAGDITAAEPADAASAVLRRLPARASSMHPVLNATGVVLHTNLGRARLSPAAVDAVAAAAGYVDVEYNLDTGQRARRGAGAATALTSAVPEADDVLIVNNGAAALLLAVTALAVTAVGAGREVLVSRGELVEIGDGFRLPALIESAGARIREVGTTNRTSAADYADALGPRTGCILKVHPSNFTMTGFTSAAGVAELARLGVPVIFDVGSGMLHRNAALPEEPDVAGSLRAGADLVTCSGDKLLGGPQAGLIFGRAELVQRCRRHPLARALRVDKLTLAALEATVTGPATPTERYLHADLARLRQRCDRVAAAVGGSVLASDGAVGGGGAPGVNLAGWAVALPAGMAQPLRTGSPAVAGRIERDRLLLDLRCVEEQDDDVLVAAVTAARQALDRA